jgi:hypothetical protein
MSSVTRFLRQIPVGASFLNNGVESDALDFIPTSGNYVGNYPPGYVVPANTTGLSSAITNVLNSGVQPVVRDMGKTIFAPFSATVGGTPTVAGFFRQYQLLNVAPISISQGFLGGVSGSTFGVGGPSIATTPGTSTYVTFYLPTAVAGVGSASAASVSPQDVNAGGQM